MSTYEMMKQEPPAYGQPVEGYQQQGAYLQPGVPAAEPQHNAAEPPPPRRNFFERRSRVGETAEGEDGANNGGDSDGTMDPGDTCIPEKALNLEFNACFHEHKSTKTFPQLNLCLGVCYKYTKLVIYHIFVFLIGIPMAIVWAIINGIMVFVLVWLYQPMLRLTIMWVYAFTPLVTVPLQAIFTPLVDVGARIFRQIRVKATLDGSFAESLAAAGRRGSQAHPV